MSIAAPEHAHEPTPELAVHVARQPLYDSRLQVAGYELLFGNEGPGASDDRATAEVVVHAVTDIGLDELVGPRPAWFTVSRRFLLELHALALPASRVILQLRDLDDADEAVAAVLGRIVREGYELALAGVATSEPSERLLKLVSAVKLDVAALGEELDAAVAAVRPFGRRLVAERIESHEQLDHARSLGFDAFQGPVFSRPKVVEGRAAPTARMTDLRSVAGLHAPTADFEDIERIVSRDPGLSYRLLRYLNSAYFSLPRTVSSVREAIALLGVLNVKRWATLIALSGIQDKPHEMVVTSVVRAKMCELLARAMGEQEELDSYFTTGMFSVLDALLDMPMEQIVESLPLAAAVSDALMHRAGRQGEVLAAVLAYEAGDAHAVHTLVPAEVPVPALYVRALAFADDTASAMVAP